MSLNSFSTAIHSRFPRAVVDIAIPAMLNHSQSIQLHTGLRVRLEKVVNSNPFFTPKNMTLRVSFLYC